MEPEPRRTKKSGDAFPAYDVVLSPDQNYTLLMLYLSRQMETELRAHLEEERGRIARLNEKKALMLFRHFERELRRKRELPSQYVYKRIPDEKLMAPYRKATVEEQATRFAAIDARNKLLEKLHEVDMLELAALIKEVRVRGLVADEQIDAILHKVDTQCEPLREENRKLREQLVAQQSSAALRVLQLANQDLEWKNGHQEGELTELRAQLSQCALKEEELKLLEAANAELRQAGPGQELLAEKMLQIIDLWEQVNERDNHIETLERRLEEARKHEEQQRAQDEERKRQRQDEEKRARLMEYMESVMEKQEADVEALRFRLEESQRQTMRAQEKCMEGVDIRQLRRELDEAKRGYDKVYDEKAALEEEYTRLFEEELDELNETPVYRLEPRTLEPRQTGETLGKLREEKRAFFIVEAKSLLRPSRIVAQGHFMTLEEDSLRGLLLKAAHGQSGRYRVRITLEDEAGARQLELVAEALAPQKIASFRELELVLDFEQSQRLRYVHTGAMPRRLVRPRGQLRVQRYEAERAVGEEKLYRFELQGRGVCVVRFDDGALLYTRYKSVSMYSVDVLVLPLR